MIEFKMKYKLGQEVETRYENDDKGFITDISIDRYDKVQYGFKNKNDFNWLYDYEIKTVPIKESKQESLVITTLEFNKEYESISGLKGILTSVAIVESQPGRINACLKSKDTHRWENMADIKLI